MSESSNPFGREIAAEYARINTCTGEWILKLAEFDDSESWVGDWCSSLVQCLQVFCDMARSTAKEKLRVARELAKRPVVRKALADGSISYSKARELTRLEGLDNDRDERYVVEAPTMSMPALEGWVKQWNWHLAPEKKPASLEDHYGIRRERGFGGGLGRIVVELPDDDIDRVFALLDTYIDFLYRRDRKKVAPVEPLRMPEVAPLEPPAPPYEPEAAYESEEELFTRRSSQARRLDALLDLLEEVALVRDDEIDIERASIAVTVQYEDLFERANGLSLTEAGSTLTGDAVRRLACDAGLHRVVVKGASAVLDVGDKTQTWNRAQRRAIRARHHHRCAAPGCGRRITHIHHVHHYADGGPTDIDNGILRKYIPVPSAGPLLQLNAASTRVTDDGPTVAHKFGDAAVVRKVRADAYDKFSIYRRGQPLECFQRWTRAAALHSGDCRLGSPHPFSELCLSEAGLGADPIDEFPERGDARLVLIGGAAFLGERSLLLQVIPRSPVRHCSHSSSAVCASAWHRSNALIARSTSRRSCARVFANTVNNTMRRPVAIQ